MADQTQKDFDALRKDMDALRADLNTLSGSLSELVGAKVDQAKASAKQAGERVQNQAQQVRETVSGQVEERPLTFGAVHRIRYRHGPGSPVQPQGVNPMPVKNPLDVLDRMRADLRVAASRLAWTAAFALLAITATIGGIGFLLAALHTYLAARTSPAEAGLIVGGLLLVVAAGLLAVAARGLRPARPSRESPAGRPPREPTMDPAIPRRPPNSRPTSAKTWVARAWIGQNPIPSRPARRPWLPVSPSVPARGYVEH